MRVSIDRDICTGHARCVALAPALFTDDEYGYGQVIGNGDVTADLAEVARRAVHGCPERAISLQDDDPTT
jgi:ferredoxin